MKDITNKIDGAPAPDGQLPASEYNDHKNELQLSVTKTGQTLNIAIVDQLARAHYINGGAAGSCVVGGTANAVELTPVTGPGGLVVPDAYATMNGLVLTFYQATPNTTTSPTINFGQTAGTLLGARNIVDDTGASLAVGRLFGTCSIKWDNGNNRWILLRSNVGTFSALNVSGAANITGALTVANDIVITTNEIHKTTSDGADTGRIGIGGGGLLGSTRGGNIFVYGNEYSGAGGQISLVAGNVATGRIVFNTGAINRGIILEDGKFIWGATTDNGLGQSFQGHGGATFQGSSGDSGTDGIRILAAGNLVRFTPIDTGVALPDSDFLYDITSNLWRAETAFRVDGSITSLANISAGVGASTESIAIDIGAGRTGNGNSIFDLVSDTTYTDYGLRIIRTNGGPNTTSEIKHRGLGDLILRTEDGGDITFLPTGSGRVLVNTSTDDGSGAVIQANGSGSFSGGILVDDIYEKTVSAGITVNSDLIITGKVFGNLANSQGSNTEDFLFDLYTDFVPNLNDEHIITGTIAPTGLPLQAIVVSIMKKTSVNVITFFGVRIDTGAGSSVTITDGNGNFHNHTLATY